MRVMRVRNRERERRSGIFWGLMLLGLGVVFLLSEQGIHPRHIIWSWWTWWPAILIASGLMHMIQPRDAGDIGGGFTMILMSVWFFANFQHWWGLTWNNSWPIALMIVGLGIMLRAIVSWWMRDRTDPMDFDPRRKEDSGVQ